MSAACRLHRCLGLGASASPLGLACDPAKGTYALAEAVNVDVRDGRILRRPGLRRLGEGGYTGLFSHDGRLYGARDGAILAIPAQGEPMVLRDGLTPGAPVAFLGVGETVYFANGFETGCLRDGAALPWGGGVWPGPDRAGRYVPPPAGHLLAWHAGRVWIADGAVVRFTEGAGLTDWVDSLAGYLPPATGKVRLLRAIAAGLLVGDATGVTLARGNDPQTMTFERVCPVPPLPGSDVSLPAGRREAVAGRELAGQAAVWAGADGVYLGLASGRVVRLAVANIPAGQARAVATGNRYQLFVRP
ncbi:MAG: hypothetical protein ACP59X_20515 [Solidesulfovibrio sp. DCME]|uniref:hypothetical protein n=1 Tax=Solidesulfovibrio sp. DCME TaxID=3447380 RepID=UPI003D12610B